MNKPRPSNDRASPLRPPSQDIERQIVAWMRTLAMQRAALPVVAEPTAAVINANTVQTLLAVAGMIEAGEHRKEG